MTRRPFALSVAASLAAGAFPALAEPAPQAAPLAARLLNDPSLGGVRAATRGALQDPRADFFVGAVQVYAWSDGALFRLYASPGEVSDVVLQPGEALVSVAAGDTARWIIGDTTSGSGAARRTHVLVKPSAAGLRTNLVIATDRRVYHVEARSTRATAMTGIAWTYPDDGLLALRSAAGLPPDPVASDLAIEQLNFNYRIEGDDPPWRPVRAFDDGRQVFIEFPAALAYGEAPPLFVSGPDGHTDLVNYRQRGRYYVVDRLFDAAELRLGGKRQEVVRLLRGSSDNGRGRRGR